MSEYGNLLLGRIVGQKGRDTVYIQHPSEKSLIKITVTPREGSNICLQIEAPKDYRIDRGELLDEAKRNKLEEIIKNGHQKSD